MDPTFRMFRKMCLAYRKFEMGCIVAKLYVISAAPFRWLPARMLVAAPIVISLDAFISSTWNGKS
jgi:hypothetical protein